MSDDFLDWLHELFADFGPIRTRPMFGGLSVYAVAAADGEDIIVGMVIDDALYLKVDADTEVRFGAAGCAPFMYRAKGREMPMSYWSAPPGAMDSAQAMLPWARLALDAALRKRRNKARGKRKGVTDRSR